MGRFVKEQVMATAKSFVSLTQIDLSKPVNMKSLKNLDIGIATRRELTRLKDKISPLQEHEFLMNCKAFMARSTEKLLEKCPLKYPIVRAARCLDPQIIAGPEEKSVKMFERLLHCLIDAKRVSEIDSDKVKREYANFVREKVRGNAKLLVEYKQYDKVKDQRIDTLLAKELKEDASFQKLWNVVKCVLLLSHGQAGVERGFSVNSQLMDNNFKEKSIVALRTIHDHIQMCGGVLEVKIDQDLRNAAKNASSRCKHEMLEERKRKEKEEGSNANKVINEEIAQLRTKRKRLIDDAKVLRKSVDSFMIRAEKEQNLTFVTKANSYKRTIADMEQEETNVQSQIDSQKKN